MAEQYKTLHPTKYYRDYLAHKIRPDGREFDNFRPIILNVRSIDTSDGSAIAKIGRTTVVCGIKAELCRPKSDKPDQGFLIPNIELPPLCSPKFKPGPPSDQAQVLTQTVADIIENSECVSLKQLSIYTDKIAWCLYADMICLDYDGSLIDACFLSLIAALKTVTLPVVEYDPALDNQQVSIEERRPLNVLCMPVSTTFAIFDDKILLADPTVEEENLCTGTITIVVKDQELCCVHKPGGSPISDEDLTKCIEISKNRVGPIINLINTTIENK